MGRLGRSLKEAVAKLAYRTSVDQLARRGIREVNVLGLDRIVALVEEAVHRSLKHRLMGLELERAAGATKDEFLKLLRSNEDLTKSRDEAVRMRERAQEEVDYLRRELARHQQALREKLRVAAAGEQVRYAGENAEIARRLDAVLAEIAEDPASGLSRLRERMLELVMDLVGREREAALRARQAAHDAEVEKLERRIAKMSSALSETEQRLAQLASLETVDEGISSIYREVQGLSPQDRRYERKKELMENIFKANLELQKGGRSGPRDRE